MSMLKAMLMKKKGGGEEYIESDGVAYTQLTDTTIEANRFVMKFQILESTEPKYVFGEEYKSGYYYYRNGLMSNGNNYGNKFGIYRGNYTSPQAEITNTTDVLEVDKTIDAVMTIDNTFICFGCHYYSTYVTRKTRIWYMEFYNGNTLVAKFIPKQENGEVGLYDEVNNKFYGNIAGSGQLILGRG